VRNTAETNATNVFCVREGVVITPHADFCLPGITRRAVMEICRELALPLEERRVSLSEFHSADEVRLLRLLAIATAHTSRKAMIDPRVGWLQE